jgi:hypothetical protein
MKVLKTACLALGSLFTIDFIYSIFNQNTTHELFIWEVDILVYRMYRLALVLLFVKLYFDQKNKAADIKE